MIRILLVDDHPIVRQGLAAVLEDQPDLEVVGSVGSADEAIRLAGRARPDVVLLDLEMPGLDGIEAIPRLSDAAPGMRVLVFTAYDTDERVRAALSAGASGYLLKGAPAEEIARGIRVVRDGGSVLEPLVAAKLIGRLSGAGSPAPAPALSQREREVLRLVAGGQANKQIARTLGISERTAKFHVASILRKLDAENRAEAAARAIQQHLV